MVNHERDRYCMGPRDEKLAGSLPWCYQTIEFLKSRWTRKDTTDKHWEETLAELSQYEVWTKVPPEQPYGSLNALLQAEIGCTVEVATATIQARAQQLAQMVEPLAQHGEIGRGRNRDYNIMSKKQGTSAAYLASRLKRDAPACAEALARGEYPSVRAACIAAGLVRDPTPLARLRAAWLKASGEERAQFLEEVQAR